MDSTVPDFKEGDEFCNTEPEEETIFHEKKKRRVSFADNITSVHVFDREEDSGTPPNSRHGIGNDGSGHTIESAGIRRDDGGSDDTEEMYFQESNDEDDDSQEPFLQNMESPGSVAGSTTSNEEDKFFGPVSASFINSGMRSDSPLSDDSHDITLDSTAFTFQFRNLMKSDERGGSSAGNLKTPIGFHLMYDSEKTPTENSARTNDGSFMVLTEVKKSISRYIGSDEKSAGGGRSSDMSLIVEDPNKYDYARLSPRLVTLLAEAEAYKVSKSPGTSSKPSRFYKEGNDLGDLKESGNVEVLEPDAGAATVRMVSGAKIVESLNADADGRSITFGQTTPIHQSVYTNGESLMIPAEVKKTISRYIGSDEKSTGGGHSSNMSLIVEDPNKYDYARLSPKLVTLLVEAEAYKASKSPGTSSNPSNFSKESNDLVDLKESGKEEVPKPEAGAAIVKMVSDAKTVELLNADADADGRSITFDQTTPIHQSAHTNGGSFMVPAEVKEPISQYGRSDEKSAGGGHSSDMSLMLDSPNKYDYARLSPRLVTLVAEAEAYKASKSPGTSSKPSRSYKEGSDLVDLKESQNEEILESKAGSAPVTVVSDAKTVLLNADVDGRAITFDQTSPSHQSPKGRSILPAYNLIDPQNKMHTGTTQDIPSGTHNQQRSVESPNNGSCNIISKSMEVSGHGSATGVLVQLPLHEGRQTNCPSSPSVIDAEQYTPNFNPKPGHDSESPVAGTLSTIRAMRKNLFQDTIVSSSNTAGSSSAAGGQSLSLGKEEINHMGSISSMKINRAGLPEFKALQLNFHDSSEGLLETPVPRSPEMLRTSESKHINRTRSPSVFDAGPRTYQECEGSVSAVCAKRKHLFQDTVDSSSNAGISGSFGEEVKKHVGNVSSIRNSPTTGLSRFTVLPLNFHNSSERMIQSPVPHSSQMPKNSEMRKNEQTLIAADKFLSSLGTAIESDGSPLRILDLERMIQTPVPHTSHMLKNSEIRRNERKLTVADKVLSSLGTAVESDGSPLRILDLHQNLDKHAEPSFVKSNRDDCTMDVTGVLKHLNARAEGIVDSNFILKENEDALSVVYSEINSNEMGRSGRCRDIGNGESYPHSMIEKSISIRDCQTPMKHGPSYHFRGQSRNFHTEIDPNTLKEKCLLDGKPKTSSSCESAPPEGFTRISSPIHSEKNGLHRVAAMREELEVLDQKVKNLTKSLQGSCKLKGSVSADETIILVNDHVEKIMRCRLIHQELKQWKLDDIECDRSSIVLNYGNLLSQRFIINRDSPVPNMEIFTLLNDANIGKFFPGLDASTAFKFVFNAEHAHKFCSSESLQQVTQVTGYLLGNLVDVLEEVLVARMDLRNLFHTSFHSPSVQQLELQLCFIDCKASRKATLVLDMTDLNCAAYPSEILPSQLQIQNSGIQTSKSSLSAEIMEGMNHLKGGHFRIFRLCQIVSLVLQASSR